MRHLPNVALASSTSAQSALANPCTPEPKTFLHFVLLLHFISLLQKHTLYDNCMPSPYAPLSIGVKSRLLVPDHCAGKNIDTCVIRTHAPEGNAWL
jgi:hypothetical protein